VK
ncbi:EAL domain protein, partial [Vibrio parahaemolyticus V-223/04]|jgi:hypothetical protein